MADTAWRLARALFRKARAAGELEPVEADLGLLARLVQSGPEVRAFINHPRIPLARKEQILCPATANALVRALFCSLVEARECDLLPAIHRSYILNLKRDAGLVDAEVRTPRPLSAEEESTLRDAVTRMAGRSAQLKVSVDPSLIGGVRVQVDGKVLDSSLRAKLASIKERLLTS